MKKIFTIILALSIGPVALAQNGGGNLHIFNNNTQNLNLIYTIFTTTLNCSSSMQSDDASTILPPGTIATYTTFAASTSTSTPPHPYPIDFWSGTPSAMIPPFIASASRYHYLKFQLRDPNNPAPMVPTLGGSVGYMQNCNSVIPSTLDVTSTANGINYTLNAQATTFGGDLWIITQ